MTHLDVHKTNHTVENHYICNKVSCYNSEYFYFINNILAKFHVQNVSNYCNVSILPSLKRKYFIGKKSQIKQINNVWSLFIASFPALL